MSMQAYVHEMTVEQKYSEHKRSDSDDIMAASRSTPSPEDVMDGR